MVSKRNFISITIIYAMVLFLFIFSVFAMDKGRDPDVNAFVDPEIQLPGADTALELPNNPKDVKNKEYFLYFGEEDDPGYSIVKQWGTYAKMPILMYESLDDYSLPRQGNKPSLVIISPKSVDIVREFPRIRDYVREGVSLFFTSLPEVNVIRDNPELMEFLGIQTIRSDSIETEGIRVLDDFFIGGSIEYLASDKELEDSFNMELNMPWYITGSGTKAYMVGLLDNYLRGYDDKNEQFPAICWRAISDGVPVYAVQGDYMSDLTGLGILSGIVYDMEDYVLYPVVNSRVISVTDFPNMSEENFEQTDLFYNRSTSQFMKDVVWPGIISISNNGKNKTTCYITTGYDTTVGPTYNTEDYSFYLNQIATIKSEAGLSLNFDGNVSLAQRVTNDQGYFESLDSKYHYNSLFLTKTEIESLSFISLPGTVFGNLGTFCSVYEPGDDLIGYEYEDITRQSVTSDLRNFTTMDDLRLRAVMTTLGYNNTRFDIHPAVWPANPDDAWQLIFDDAGNNYSRFIYRFSDFKTQTASESDQKIRNFLSIDYDQSLQDNEITLNVKKATEDKTWFIYRGHGRKIDKMIGGEYKNLKNGDYLITVNGNSAKILLKKNDKTVTFG